VGEKYDGLRKPGRTNIEFILLAEEYLREMPIVLEGAMKTIERLANHVHIEDFRGREDNSKDIDYLIEWSQKLTVEARSTKETVRRTPTLD